MNDNLQPGQNTGFVAVNPKLGDFMAGAETAILSAPVLPSGDWRPFLPTNAGQLMKDSQGISHGDSNACVSFAADQDVETLLNFQIKTHLMDAGNLAWLHSNGYIDSNGSVSLSKRFRAKMSGTNPAVGNSLPNVWSSLKNDGAVPDSAWPMPTAQFDALASAGVTDVQKYWDAYYAAIPAELVALGKQFATRFPVLYEWVVYPAAPAAGAQLAQDLKVAPLEIATAVCAGWNTDDPIKACGPGTAHATLLTCVEADRYDVLDHYVPWQKQFAGDYSITYGMRGVIQAVKPPLQILPYVFTKQLAFGSATNDPQELKALQMALQTLKSKSGVPYMRAGVFGPFGPQTAAALAQFERDHGILDPQPGCNFGPQNRAAMNAALVANK